MRIGIDVGGTKISAIALGDRGETLIHRRLDTPVGDYRATIEAIVGVVATIESELGERGTIGIGIPGALSPRSGLVRNANSVCLIGRAMDRDLADAIGRPVRLANDANCFALSEATDGAAAGAGVVFGVILGTGVGGGVVNGGRILAGANAIAGEWGHNPLPWPEDDERPGPACYCGKRGCVETFLSGPAMVADHRARTGAELSARDLAAAERAGDRAARQTIERYEQRLARALATVINTLDPDCIVLGGGLSKMTRLYETVPVLWQSFVFSDHVDTRLLPPRHGDDSGVRGAAWLWPKNNTLGPS